MDVFPKFIVEHDDELGFCLIMAKCTYHKQLVTKADNVHGGGWWKMDHEIKMITFNGKSEDFGKATIENIQKCIKSKNVYTNSSLSTRRFEDFTFYYRKDDGEIINLN
jgi:hypothetical protein